jgi:hypothetical protein
MLRMLTPRHRQVNGNITISTIEKFNKNLGRDYLQERYRNIARPFDLRSNAPNEILGYVSATSA